VINKEDVALINKPRRVCQTGTKPRATIYRGISSAAVTHTPRALTTTTAAPPLLFLTHFSSQMAPKPASTGGKAPASTAASKAPAKTTEGKKAAKKTSKAPADGEKKKRRKTRKETYSSYIYKGTIWF
jgi:hypothetical protein